MRVDVSDCHLSQHPRARDVMARVHWNKNNNFIHYGGSGIDMFRVGGYSADRDRDFTGQDAFGFCFDDVADETSISSLMTQRPQMIFASEDGMSLGELSAQGNRDHRIKWDSSTQGFDDHRQRSAPPDRAEVI